MSEIQPGRRDLLLGRLAVTAFLGDLRLIEAIYRSAGERRAVTL